MIGLLRDHLGDDFFVPFDGIPMRPSAILRNHAGVFSPPDEREQAT
jgi:hypothetical protein